MIPSLRGHDASTGILHYSSKTAKWLGDDHLVKRGRATNWKRQYRLRDNWSKGICKVSVTEIGEKPLKSPLFARFHEEVLVTVDEAVGLRAWSMKGEQHLLATVALNSGKRHRSPFPTSLALDTTNCSTNDIGIIVGFDEGTFSIYQLLIKEQTFVNCYTHTPSVYAEITAVAYSSPYILTMSKRQSLSFYHLDLKVGLANIDPEPVVPRLVTSLVSDIVYPPVSLTIRSSSTNVLATIVYAMPTYRAGWTVGLQELRLTSDGSILGSRLASAISPRLTPSTILEPSSPSSSRPLSPRWRDCGWKTTTLSTKPTTLSYNHPYLLAAYPDNTLTLFMVVSHTEDLSVGVGTRLWGHTSSVSVVHVSDRGKAVSISTSGNELRVWELEGDACQSNSKRRIVANESSVQVRTEGTYHHDFDPMMWSVANLVNKTREELTQVYAHVSSCRKYTPSKDWITFDEEKVIVLGEKNQGIPAIVVYDFT